MKIYRAKQIRQLDQYTISNEPIASIDLMERASKSFVNYFVIDFPNLRKVDIICGAGNNGGDGLAIARLLHNKKYEVSVFVLHYTKNFSEDFTTNLQRLKALPIPIHEIETIEQLQKINFQGIIIDAILGSGLNQPLKGFLKAVVDYLNTLAIPIVSVDIPTGVFAENATIGSAIHTDKVYSFQYPKLAFMLPENASFIDSWQVLDIGLLKQGEAEMHTSFEYLTRDSIQSIYCDRGKFSHKGTYGHLLLIAGSKGKAGAAILAAKAALRSGIGLLSLFVPEDILPILQEAVPEAMCLTLSHEALCKEFQTSKTYSALAIGPGIGTSKSATDLVTNIIENYPSPMVIDADGLNILAQNRSLLKKLPELSILTPHPGEFRRLVGEWGNDFERLSLQQELAKQYNIIVVLKGAHTSIAHPNGQVAFNSTGNNGMATAGSGDTLTGIIAGLLTQGYAPFDAAKLGVYLHGLAGDLALHKEHPNSLIASDITAHLGQAFKAIDV
ncbi:MAG: NAD(P)H-hydrate dehydratase [Chitinophagales bacterium]